MAALTCHMSAIILDLLALVSADRPSTRSGDVNVSYYIREQLSTGGGLVYARRFEQHEIAKVADLGDQWTDIYTDLYGVLVWRQQLPPPKKPGLVQGRDVFYERHAARKLVLETLGVAQQFFSYIRTVSRT